MKIRSSEDRKAGKAKFVCKECKMAFQSKDSLERHKNKAKHFTGLVYFGKHDG